MTAGKVNYRGDCEHTLANSTIDIPDLPEHLRDAEFTSARST
jgi:hypothetical protein